jgi:putative copper export protein
MLVVRRVLSSVALLAIAVWVGGLLALGAVAAPVVFGMVSFPSNADAMTVVFRRFDLVAMTCAALVLATESVRPIAGLASERLAPARAGASLIAAIAAVVEGVKISPRIADLHASGAIRGVDEAGRELARLHDLAEACGKIEVALLAVVVILHVVALSAPFRARTRV